MSGTNPWQAVAEREYLSYLESERHLFAWCLVEYDGMAWEAAQQQACDFYRYQQPGDALRGSLFQDSAWHWAMLHVVGEQYWKKRLELAHPSERFRAEAQALEAKSKRAWSASPSCAE